MATFSMTGNFITQTARDLWAEGEYDKSLSFLKTTVPDMGLEYQIELIEGRSKLIGISNVDFVSDDWKMPNDYPKFSDMLNKAKIGYKYYQDHIEKQIVRATEIYNTFLHFHDEYEYLTNNHWKSLAQEWQLLLPEAKENLIPPFYLSAWLRATYKRQPNNETISLLEHKSIVYKYAHPSIFDSREAYDRWCAYYFIYEPDRSDIWDERNKILNRIYGIIPDKIEQPEPYIPELDPKMNSEFGWLLPNGDYYGCLWLGHIKLATALMPNSENSEHSLEKLGAVKIHMNDYHEFYITPGNKKPTDEQITKIFEYCIKHNKDYNKYRFDI